MSASHTSGKRDRFHTTHWSLVVSAAGGSRQALEDLCAAYWQPLYGHVRRMGYDVADAQDLTQSFFARLLEKPLLGFADRGRGRFRTFLLTALHRFVINEWKRDRRDKRGGGRHTLSINFDASENESVPEPSLKGLCPSCLMVQLAGEGVAAAAGVRSPGGGRGFQPPKIEELAPHFSKLEILELVGHGGMSAVYKARQKSLDRVVALKVLPQEVAEIAGGAERFTRETRTLARLSHPSIVALYDAGKAGPWCFCLMEFVEGPNLRQFLGDSRLSPSEVLKLVPDICDGLQYAHEQGVVHRDVKPENILLDRHGRAKIADFGLAKLLRPAGSQAATATGRIVGTPHYIAPEQMERPSEIDHRADLYSLGVLLYEMLTGELPVGDFDPPSYASGSDPRLDGIVLRSLARDPHRRYQQARDVRDDLLSVASGKPETFAVAVLLPAGCGLLYTARHVY
jgi:tRNA A-37 threonylcarbamoyl transferase component Bud32